MSSPRTNARNRYMELALAMLAGLVGNALWNEPAEACSGGLPTAPSEVVPLSGPILVDIPCTDCDTERPRVTVRAGGVEVAGKLELTVGELSSFAVFVPDAPLTDATEYEITVEGYEDDPQTIIAREAAAFGTDGLSDLSWEFGHTQVGVGDAHCCPPVVRLSGTCDTPPSCFHEEQQTRATVMVEPSESLATANYVYRVILLIGDVAEPQAAWGRTAVASAEQVFPEAQARYCAKVEALNLLNGSISEAKRCEDADPDVDYQQRMAVAYEVSRLADCSAPPGEHRDCDPDTERCSAAPPALIEAWCDAQLACKANEAEPDDEACVTHRLHYCGGDLNVTILDAGASSDAGTSDGDVHEPSASEDSGCSVAGSHPQARSMFPLVVLGLLAVRTARRVRRRRAG